MSSNTYDPTGVLIDGAIPRTPQERCIRLIDVGRAFAQTYDHDTAQLDMLDREVKIHLDNTGFNWTELEDDIVNVIDDMLPVQYCIDMSAGDVVVMSDNDE